MTLDRNRLDGACVPRWALTLMCLGVLGGAFFFLIYTAEGVTRPGYDAFTQAISALGLGPGGWVQRASFIGFGVLTIAAATGWWRALAPGPVAIIYSLLKGLVGVGLMMDGIFSQDPSPQYPPGATIPSSPTMHAEIHALFAYVAITCVSLSCFAIAVRLARAPGWRLWAVAAVLTGAATMVLISIYGSLIDHGPAGVFERLATGVESVFTLLLVGRLVLQAVRGARPATRLVPTPAVRRSAGKRSPTSGTRAVTPGSQYETGVRAMADPVAASFEIVGEDGAKLRRSYGNLFGWRTGASDDLSRGMIQ